MRRARAGGWILAAMLLAVGPAGAIETDQYYAWGREIADATPMLNAKVNLEISRVLDEVNRKRAGERVSCGEVRRRIVAHFRLFIFHDLELWADNTRLIERVPATVEEELEFRRRYLYHDHGVFDFVTMIPPSPTIELAGVRTGTDKLTHFFSEGWWYYKWLRKRLRRGMSFEQAELEAIDHGILTERTILGMGASGVLSIADLEANHQGMMYLWELCDAEEPLLERTAGGWQLREPFDFGDWVTPEWDESWQTSIFTERRWNRVRPILEDYCPLLDSPSVRERRAEYAHRDTITRTELRVTELVAAGKLRDPRQFSITALCRGADPESRQPTFLGHNFEE